ncbi:hypothetical protein [Hymenobacter terrenus]|nr:hypothetical protein [Hymenobacter terrenus]
MITYHPTGFNASDAFAAVQVAGIFIAMVSLFREPIRQHFIAR